MDGYRLDEETAAKTAKLLLATEAAKLLLASATGTTTKEGEAQKERRQAKGGRCGADVNGNGLATGSTQQAVNVKRACGWRKEEERVYKRRGEAKGCYAGKPERLL